MSYLGKVLFEVRSPPNHLVLEVLSTVLDEEANTGCRLLVDAGNKEADIFHLLPGHHGEASRDVHRNHDKSTGVRSKHPQPFLYNGNKILTSLGYVL